MVAHAGSSVSLRIAFSSARARGRRPKESSFGIRQTGKSKRLSKVAPRQEREQHATLQSSFPTTDTRITSIFPRRISCLGARLHPKKPVPPSSDDARMRTSSSPSRPKLTTITARSNSTTPRNVPLVITQTVVATLWASWASTSLKSLDINTGLMSSLSTYIVTRLAWCSSIAISVWCRNLSVTQTRARTLSSTGFSGVSRI